ncbi:MAG: PEGA domain-containing protein [Algisphaera sp.]
MRHPFPATSIALFLFATLWLPLTATQAQPASTTAAAAPPTSEAATATTPLRVALFVKNNGDEQLDAQRPVFENLMIAELTRLGFEIISPQEVTAALSTFHSADSTPSATPSDNPPMATAQLDTLLEQNSSALRLAQTLNANYLLVGSIDRLDTATQRVIRPDLNIDREVTTHKLLTTYKILDAGLGGSLFSGAATASLRSVESESLQGSTHTLGDLLHDAALQMSEQLALRGGADALPAPTTDHARVNLEVTCAVQDLNVPEIIKNESGEFVLSHEQHPLEPLSVTVELDGVAIGSAPGAFGVLPGLHKLRLTHENFTPWERTINVFEGQTLTVNLTLNDQGREEWQNMAAMYEELKQTARGSEDRSKIAQGIATLLEQSGYRVDTQDAPAIEQNIIDNMNKAN